jgi:hypothetical protein
VAASLAQDRLGFCIAGKAGAGIQLESVVRFAHT